MDKAIRYNEYGAFEEVLFTATSVGLQQNFYLDTTLALADNYTLSNSPSAYPEVINTKAVTNSTSPVFLERFVSAPLGKTTIPAGDWIFKIYTSTTNDSGDNKVYFRINKRVILNEITGTWTGSGTTRTFTASSGTPFAGLTTSGSRLTAPLIETPNQTGWVTTVNSSTVVTVNVTDSGYINESNVSLTAIYYWLFGSNTTDIIGSAPTFYEITSTQPEFAGFNDTDRLVVAFFANTDQVSTRNISLYYGGTQHYTHFETPISINHNDLAGRDGNNAHPISAITDLQTNLNNLVPYVNATTDVNLGDNMLTVDAVQYDLTPTSTSSIGMTKWNVDDSTLDLQLNSDVTLQIGQEQHLHCMNQTGSTINNGTPVSFAGSIGNSSKPKIIKSIADGTQDDSYIIGLATQNITNGSLGFVTQSGIVRGVDTTGTPFGETWADSDVIYVSATTAGFLTKTQPAAPNYNIPIGIVIHSHSNGSILVTQRHISKMTDLVDVNGSPLNASGLIPVWNNSNSYFDFTENINNFYKTEIYKFTFVGTQTPTLNTLLGLIKIRKNATIQNIEIVSRETGSIELDFKTANYTNTPSSMSSICGTDYLSISSSTKTQKTSFTGWTLTLTENDYIGIFVRSVTSIMNCEITIKVV